MEGLVVTIFRLNTIIADTMTTREDEGQGGKEVGSLLLTIRLSKITVEYAVLYMFSFTDLEV